MGLSGVGLAAKWLRGLDLNQRPLGYEPNELPGCSTPHIQCSNTPEHGSNARQGDCDRIEASSSDAAAFFIPRPHRRLERPDAGAILTGRSIARAAALRSVTLDGTCHKRRIRARCRCSMELCWP